MSNIPAIPNKCDILVIGGGPAGTTTAGHLAKEGYDVVLIDKGQFPRNTVGESIVPQAWKLFDMLGVSEKVDKLFVKKSGGIAAWDGKIAYLKFADFGYDRPGLHVERDKFDDMLLRHVEERGVKVFENVIARNVDLSKPGAPCVKFDDRRGGSEVSGEIEAKFLVDASGYSAMMSKHFNSRKFLQSDRKFMSVWGYWKNVRYYDAEGHSHPASEMDQVKPTTLQVKVDDGWAWHIIMRDSTSIGFAFYSDKIRGMSPEDREQYYIEAVKKTPYLKELVADAEYIPGSMLYRPDFSYYSEAISGDDFICVGDAAAFVDPVFSQGILGCMFHGTAGAWAVSSSLKSPARKKQYMEMYRRRILGFYSAARLIALGHFGAEGVDMELAKEFTKGLPKSEIELLYTASWQTDRHQNLIRLAEECGMDASKLAPKTKILETLA